MNQLGFDCDRTFIDPKFYYSGGCRCGGNDGDDPDWPASGPGTVSDLRSRRRED